MKKYISYIASLLLSASALAQQLPELPQLPPLPGSANTQQMRSNRPIRFEKTDDFRKFLQSVKWTWPALPNGKPTTVTFAPNGSAANSERGWGGLKYNIIGLNKVTMHNNKGQTATMTFSSDYSSATVVDFTGVTGVATAQ